MTDELTQLEQWAAPLLAKLEPSQRRQVLMAVARDLRRSQQRRIAAQSAPDGSPFPPRRVSRFRAARPSIRERTGPMFRKLRTARWLKTQATSHAAEVGFMGRVARLARVHQEGLEDRASAGGRLVRYPQRRLLGFSAEDITRTRDLLITHLTSF